MSNATTIENARVRNLRSNGTRTHGAAAGSVIIIIALLALAVYFYMRAMSSDTGHEARPRVAAQPEATTSEATAAADAGARTDIDPGLVKSLDAVINPPGGSGAVSGSPLPVPQAQVDLIKQVFAPELVQ